MNVDSEYKFYTSTTWIIVYVPSMLVYTVVVVVVVVVGGGGGVCACVCVCICVCVLHV